MPRTVQQISSRFTLSIAIFLVATVCFAEAETGIDYSYIAPMDERDRITIEDLKDLITSQDLTKIEDVIKVLPRHLRERYVLMYRSKSLQDASPLAPRAILYGEKADLVISFNGEPSQRGYNALEVMQFRKNTQSFEFFEITFNDDKSVSFSEANPRKCMECHQSSRRQNVDPRPNWEAYNIWPGAYGSMDGYIRRKITNDKYFTGRLTEEDKVYIKEQSEEMKNIKEFERIKINHPRYKYLSGYDSTAPKYFSEFLGRHNFDRIVRLMRESAPFEFVKYALAAKSTSVCYIKKPFISDQQLKYLGAEHLDLQRDYDKEFTVSSLIHLLFTAQGVDTSDWSMNFRSNGRLGVREEFGLPFSPWVHLYESLERVEPGLTEKSNCKQLTKSHHEAFAELMTKYPNRPINWQTEVTSNSHGIIETCAECHTSGHSKIPYIAFDDPSALKTSLNRGGYASGSLFDEILYRVNLHTPGKLQMPPTGNFTLQDKDRFITHLNQLRGHSN